MAVLESTSPTTQAMPQAAFATSAPRTDPYLKPETVRQEAVAFKGLELPPVMHGTQPGLDLHGNPRDYVVSVMWIDRQQVEGLMGRIVDEHPDLSFAVGVLKSYVGHLDTQRSEARLHMAGALSALKNGDSDQAARGAEIALSMFCRWDDARRLMLS